MTSNFPKASGALLLALFAGLLQACFQDNTSAPTDRDVAHVRVQATVPALSALSKGQAITLKRLILVLTSNATPADTVRDTITTSTTPFINASSTAEQTVSKNYALKGLRTWKVVATVYDLRDSVIHRDSAITPSFLRVADTATLSLNLASRYAMYEARFASLPDSVNSSTGPNKQLLRVTRLVLRINGQTVRDSTASPYFAALSQHVLGYDYVRVNTAATEPGVPPLGEVGDLYAVDFPNADTGFMVGSPYNYRSTDGGLSWHQHIDAVGHPTAEFKYVSYFSGTQGAIGGDSTYRIVENGGGIQPAVRTGHVTNTTAGPVAMATALVGYDVLNTTGPDGGTGYRQTTDGGATWALRSSYGNNVYGLHCISAIDCWAVGYRGQIRKNADMSGGFFTLQRSAHVDNAALYDVHFVNGTHGWTVGNIGTILATTNGGTTWIAQTSGTTQKLNSVYFLDQSNGYAVGENGTLLSTVNGGGTWTLRPTGTENHLRGISFAGPTGWIVGTNGTILRIGGVQTVELLVYGQLANWNSANPLFRGIRYIAPTPGNNDSVSLALNWMGPNTGVEKVSVTIGKVGKTTLNGGFNGQVPKRASK